MIFITDDKGYLRAYDLSWLVEILTELMKNSDENKKSKGKEG